MLMRPATAADVPAVAAMILSRSAWLEEQGWPTWRGEADSLALQADHTPTVDSSMWVLDDDGRIVGCTTVLTSAPPWGWTAEEFTEPASYLYTTCTDPAYREAKPGTLIALWAVDRAARLGHRWVRRGCLFPGLVDYYQRQGFTLHHTVPRTNRTVYLLARRAELLPELDISLTMAAT